MTDGSLHILLVEDEELDAQVVRYTLQRSTRHYEIETARCLEDAIRSLRNGNTIDVVILDLGLPDGAGIGNVERIQQIRPDVPIVVLTGWDEAFTEKLTAAGAEQFLTKSDIGNGELEKCILAAAKVPPSRSAGESEAPHDSRPTHILPETERLELLQLATSIRLKCSDLLLEQDGEIQASNIREIASIAGQLCDRLT